jgi:hypothetical protein
MNDNDNDLDRLLRPPVEPLPVPPGTFDRIRRTVTRRRRIRAAVSASAAVVVIGALVPAALQLPSDNRDIVRPADQPLPTATASPSETSQPTPTETPTPIVTLSEPPPASSPAAGPTPSATPSASAHVQTTPRCHSRELDMGLGPVEGAAGNRYAALIFTNRGDRVCHLQGRPGVSVLDADRRQIGPAAVYEPGNPHRVLDLSPGETASTALRWVSDAAGRCRPESTWLRAYPPGDTAPILIPASIQLCGDVFSVRNLTSGSTGISG